MKKNYSTPEFMLVALGSNDLICTSESMETGGRRDGVTLSKQRNSDIWGEGDE